MCLSGGVVLGLWGLTGGEPWFGGLLGSANSLYDVVAGITTLLFGLALVVLYRRAVTERLEEPDVDTEAAVARVLEFD